MRLDCQRPSSSTACGLVAAIVVVVLSTRTNALMTSTRAVLDHLFKARPPTTTPQELANVRIPRSDNGGDDNAVVLAYCCDPKTDDKNPNRSSSARKERPILILIHEFFGLSKSICDKADALADELQCTVIAPDTFRGQSSTFIPKCIWLALSTPQKRVNQDLDDVVAWAHHREREQRIESSSQTPTSQPDDSSRPKLAIMGFCYGGGKAIRYTTQVRPDAATVVCYGSPILDSSVLSNLRAPVCGVFGERDFQFPVSQIQKFQDALSAAGNVGYDVRIYEDVGHAFWKNMDQIRSGEQPQTDAYKQVTSFLSMYFCS